MKTVGLSKRMEAGAGLLDAASCIADIGCDHAHVSICLKQRNVAGHVIAMDIGEGPLLKAKENIENHGMAGMIELRLSDGAKKLLPGEADAAIIMGMGGPLIEKILSEGRAVFKEMKQIVLGAQSEIGHLRRFLYENDYTVAAEQAVFEEGKYYILMKAVNGKNPYTGKLTAEQLELYFKYGDRNIQRDIKVYNAYLAHEEEKLKNIYSKLCGADTGKSNKRKEQIAEEIRYIGMAAAMAGLQDTGIGREDVL